MLWECTSAPVFKNYELEKQLMHSQNIIVTAALVAALSLCSVSLFACGGSSDASASVGSAASQPSSSASQDNCYGDDLPKLNK